MMKGMFKRFVMLMTVLFLAILAGSFLIGVDAALAQEAATDKNPIPSIKKFVKEDDGSWVDSRYVEPGQGVEYKIELTLPENAAELHEIDYTVIDEPNAIIHMDWNTTAAYILFQDGDKKELPKPVSTVNNDGSANIVLGNLKQAAPQITYGDTVVLLCHASIDAGAKPGEYPNVAQLKYILDGASGTTVKVMALVKVVNPPAPQRESVVPVSKTGDVSGLLLGGVAVIFVFGCGGLLIRANRKGRR